MSYEPLRIDTDEGELEFDRDNAELYHHLGEWAVYDHIFLVFSEDDPPTAEYIWHNDSRYQAAQAHIRRHYFPQHINLPRASAQDIAVFNWQFGVERMYEDNSFPQDWAEDEADGA